MVLNVTHGTFNSAAKLSGTLSDAVGSSVLDESHQHKRQMIKEKGAESGSRFMAAGKGLWHGITGGVSGIVSETYTGASRDGFTGTVKGVMKGGIGLVTKTGVGLLDFASGLTGAISHVSKDTSGKHPSRSRPPRCCFDAAGLLPAYSEPYARAQELLFYVNENNYKEMFIALEDLNESRPEKVQALISSEIVYILGDERGHKEVMNAFNFSEMFSCCCVPVRGKYYIELTMKYHADDGSSASDYRNKPLILCDSESSAQRVVHKINYAKNLFEEKRNTLLFDT